MSGVPQKGIKMTVLSTEDQKQLIHLLNCQETLELRTEFDFDCIFA